MIEINRRFLGIFYLEDKKHIEALKCFSKDPKIVSNSTYIDLNKAD